MTDYIPREAVLEFVEPDARPFLAERIKSIPAADVVERASGIIGVIPAADVRPVVLCRDCIYYYKDADGYEMCDNSEGYDHVTEDGFCAWAKKREES